MKLQTYKRSKTVRAFTLLVLIAMFIFSGLQVYFQNLTPSTALAATTCGSVYDQLPSWITTRVNENKSTYIKVSQETGVPWQMLAAIHYREFNLRRDINPSNGQGIYQLYSIYNTDSTYQALAQANTVSDDNFLQQTRYAANFIQNKAKTTTSTPIVSGRSLIMDETDINLIKSTLFSYNGRASSYAQQAETYGFSSVNQPFEGSPYVMNLFDCARSAMKIITTDGSNTPTGTDTRLGAFTLFARLKGDPYWLSLMSLPSDTYLPSGTYSFSSAITNKSFDITDGSLSPGTKLQLYDKNNTSAQQWYLQSDSDGYYTIRNIASGRYIDSVNGGTTNGNPIQIWDANGSCAQKWSIRISINGYAISNKCSGKVIDLPNASTANGTKLQLWENNSSGAQKWNIESINTPTIIDGLYEIDNPSGLALEIAGGSTSSGTPVQLWDSNGTASQLWQFSRQTDGSYTIKNPASGKYLDAINAGSKPGTGLQIFDNNITCAQKWFLSYKTPTLLTVSSSCGQDAVLDVAGGAIYTQGTTIQLWNSNQTTAQQWVLKKIPATLQDGNYTVKSAAGLALEIAGGSTSSGTPVQLWDSNGTASQLWQFSRQTDGSYTIKNPASGKYLDIKNGEIQSSTPVQIWNGNTTCAQKWLFWLGTDGKIALQSTCSQSLFLDISGGNINARTTRAQLYQENGSGSQQFIVNQASL